MVLFAIAILLTVGSLLFTLLVRSKDIPEPAPVSPLRHLEERKARVYENLRDLQFEYRLGKLSDEDYQKTKQSLQKELAGVLAEIDALQQPGSAAAAAKAAATQKAQAAKAQAASSLCPHCGAKFAQALKFCGECGKAMAS